MGREGALAAVFRLLALQLSHGEPNENGDVNQAEGIHMYRESIVSTRIEV